ncbi:molybdate ABC transporter substrate-binding protein [Bradyrhizobium genosp. P]|uniref:molybdate ABC transporter substrate-binding protein n=1 Tax=Bradyrhizobium genosp. P TaxID=83641 RepID=UPI003CF66EDD
MMLAGSTLSILLLLMVGNPEAANIEFRRLELAHAGQRDRNVVQAEETADDDRELWRQECFADNRFCLTKLIENGLALSEGTFTYAMGKFMLWGSSTNFVNRAETLKKPCSVKPSTCIPAAASYGPAVPQAMKARDPCEAMQQNLVHETTVAHIFQLAEPRNAGPGVVALSQFTDRETDSRRLARQEFLDPFRRHAVLLEAGIDKGDGYAFVDFIKGPEAHANIAPPRHVREASS